jgi:hypothetical protein
MSMFGERSHHEVAYKISGYIMGLFPNGNSFASLVCAQRSAEAGGNLEYILSDPLHGQLCTLSVPADRWLLEETSRVSRQTSRLKKPQYPNHEATASMAFSSGEHRRGGQPWSRPAGPEAGAGAGARNGSLMQQIGYRQDHTTWRNSYTSAQHRINEQSTR